ncbi:hypothetical protein [Alteromonas sp. ASW11-130]|uniref:hypothetical protein n=1 Tax=Alteromonas sp. ASW11-130 TaxID=3015775 RepID=UPI002241E743|nr:hypothetical protein [Alteromonas sp. ASW11-130]MCW8092936.1 hypothetical protein [Alteromonas sp. ASW11-130]
MNNKEVVDVDLMNEIFIEGYKQGRQDGFDGMHISPQSAFKQFVKSLSCNNLKMAMWSAISGKKVH